MYNCHQLLNLFDWPEQQNSLGHNYNTSIVIIDNFIVLQSGMENFIIIVNYDYHRRYIIACSNARIIAQLHVLSLIRIYCFSILIFK